MKGPFRIDLGIPGILEFRGPDAVRFLNGQLTQDVRLATPSRLLPSCVTDAKGKLLFRVSVTAIGPEILWVIGDAASVGDLETRLTRYLIADDVEVSDLTGQYRLVHFTAPARPAANEKALARDSERFGEEGQDVFFPCDSALAGAGEFDALEGDALEAFRISRSIPAWGKELKEDMLPPEAGLEATDISYQKGCYIGQEVISRIKSAGKVNKRLTSFRIDGEPVSLPAPLITPEGDPAGELTSVSPRDGGGGREALGYLKRGAETAGQWRVAQSDGEPIRVTLR